MYLHGQKILTTFKKYRTWSTNFERNQNFFELTDGLGININFQY